MTDAALANITAAERALALAETPSEAANVADIAAAAATYAKRSDAAVPVINRAVRIKLNAERKAGELLRGMEMQAGARTPRSDRASPRLADINITKKQSSRWQSLADIPEETWCSAIAADTRELHSRDLYRFAKQTNPKPNGKKAAQASGIYTDFSDIAALGLKFGTVYADPPWRYSNQGTRAATNNHYDGTLTVDDICAMPVEDICAEQAHLHLWTTNAFLYDTQRILEAWGFEFKSTFVWVKPQMGIGNYWRNSHELLITGVRGGLTAQSKAEMSWINCKRGRHSAKPMEVRHRIERLSPGPYLELFGRSPVQGWVVFGNQVSDLEEMAL